MPAGQRYGETNRGKSPTEDSVVHAVDPLAANSARHFAFIEGLILLVILLFVRLLVICLLVLVVSVLVLSVLLLLHLLQSLADLPGIALINPNVLEEFGVIFYFLLKTSDGGDALLR